MPIKHRIVQFVSASVALATVLAKRKDEVGAAYPLPPEPFCPRKPVPPKSVMSNEAVANHIKMVAEWEEAKKKIFADYEKSCEPVFAARAVALKAAMAEVVITQEEGHPDIPSDQVVRDRTEGRCRVVGCTCAARPSRQTGSGKKARRGAQAFCRKHSGVRGMIPRTDGFFIIRADSAVGVAI